MKKNIFLQTLAKTITTTANWPRILLPLIGQG